MDSIAGLLALGGLLFLAWLLLPSAPEMTAGVKTPLVKGYAVLFGLGTTLAFGLFAGPILKMGVTVKSPRQLGDEEDLEKGGGGPFIGFLERLLFFASIWSGAYVLAGGWLTLKVAAKWAAWQHVVKVPEVITGYVSKDYEIKNQLATRLLGRFLLGTLYNVVCGLIGGGFARFLLATFQVK